MNAFSNASTFVEVLKRRAEATPLEFLYTFLKRPFSESEETELSDYAHLYGWACAIAADLQYEGVKRGDRVLLLYPPGRDLIHALFGCFFAGAIAVLHPPPRAANHERLRAIFDDSQPTRVLAPRGVAESAREILPDAKFIVDNFTTFSAIDYREEKIGGDDIALLQYTSGSTTRPKGVMISHANLIHNCALIQKAFGHDENSHGVIWLPPYHDMGLIGGILQPLFCGFPVTLFSPEDFLMRPARWLQLIASTRATTSGAPNFAYELCARKVTLEQKTPEQKSALDLSSWRVAFCGAESVRAATLDEFSRTFSACGFRRESFLPCYGLAEATLLASGEKPDAAPRVLERDGRNLVSCGKAPREVEIKIVEPETQTSLTDGISGEIWLRSSSVARGYWNKAEVTAETFENFLADGDGPFLKTGDMGFVDNGELFVNGRSTDIIISAGRKHHPEDIEYSVLTACESTRACAAFSVEREEAEQLVIAVEIVRRALPFTTGKNSLEEFHEELRATIRRVVASRHDLRVAEVLVLRPNSLPRTPSGKIQRHLCRNIEAQTASN